MTALEVAAALLTVFVVVATVLSRLERRERRQSEGIECPPCDTDCPICTLRKGVK